MFCSPRPSARYRRSVHRHLPWGLLATAILLTVIYNMRSCASASCHCLRSPPLDTFGSIYHYQGTRGHARVPAVMSLDLGHPRLTPSLSLAHSMSPSQTPSCAPRHSTYYIKYIHDGVRQGCPEHRGERHARQGSMGGGGALGLPRATSAPPVAHLSRGVSLRPRFVQIAPSFPGLFPDYFISFSALLGSLPLALLLDALCLAFARRP